MSKKIIQVTDLDVEGIYSRIQKGEILPRHSSLWGYDSLLDEGIDVIVVRLRKTESLFYNYIIRPLFAKLGIINIPLAIDTIKALKKNPDVKLIYSHYITLTSALSFLRKLGIIKVPVIGLAHDAFLEYTDINAWKRHDMVISLCESTLSLARLKTNVPSCCLHYVDWGADIRCINQYKPAKPPTRDFFLATGVSNRDYDLLVRAFRDIPKQKLIIVSSLYRNDNLPPNVSLINNVGSDSYYDMLPLYYNATASIIPLRQNLSWCCGASIIFQSIAMGCPLIVSECQANVIDAEKEGVGLNVRIGSKQDIIDSVIKMSTDNELWEKCSKNGIALSLTRYNYDIFCCQLIGYVKTFIE